MTKNNPKFLKSVKIIKMSQKLIRKTTIQALILKNAKTITKGLQVTDF